MEVIAFAIGLDPIINHGQRLVQQYRTWKGNKEQASELCESFREFEADLALCLNRLQENAVNLPQQSRVIIDNDIIVLTRYLTSSRAAAESINKRISGNRLLQFLRANAVARDCDTLISNLEEARKLLGAADKHVDLRCEVQQITIGLRELTSSPQQKFYPGSSPIATTTSRREGSVERNVFQAYFDTPGDTSKLVFHFDAKDVNGNASTQEGTLLQLLLNESPHVNREIVVRGIGGVGKTSLLRGIRAMDSIKKRFEHGVYNILVGMDATHGELIESLSTVVQNSGGNEKAEAMRTENDMKKVSNIFQSWFANKQCLFVIDDVWETKDIPLSTIHELIKLHVSGRDSKVLLTTRNPEIASEAERHFGLEPRGVLDHESRAILLRYSGIKPHEGERDDFKAVNKILEHCHGLPLFLAVSGKAVRTLSFRRGHEGCAAYHVYAQSLESSIQRLLSTDIGDYKRLSARLMISIKLLEGRKQDLEFRVHSTMGELHRRLSVITKQTRVPMNMLKNLWELEDENQAATVAREFEQVGLADMDFQKRASEVVEMLRLHDSIYKFAVSEAHKHGEECFTHETLIRRYSQCLTMAEMSSEWWHSCLKPDRYIHENLCRHLLSAGRASELVRLLLKPQWAKRQLNVNGIPFLNDDFSTGIKAVQDRIVAYSEEECFETEVVLQLISDSVTLSSAFISKNDTELWFQLHGRLKRYADNYNAIREYVGWMETEVARPVALCLNDFLGGPGGANTKIISVGSSVRCMVVLGDEKYVACGCYDGHIFVVNICESDIERWWKAHDEEVCAISVGRNGTRLLSGSKDGTAKVWDAATSQRLALFGDHKLGIKGVGVLKDGKRAISIFEDGSAQIWEMDTGRVVLTPFTIHERSPIRSVALLGHRNEYITGGDDRKLRLWSAMTGVQVGDCLESHEDFIDSIAVTPDERRIVSRSADGTIRVWDSETHKEIMNPLKAESATVICMSVSKDGTRLVAGSFDERMIQVWDLEAGTQVCEPLEGHGQAVTGVSFLKSCDSIVSCSIDGTVRVWDIRRKKAERVADRHESAVEGVAFTPNGEVVVSASYDQTLRIWDPRTGKQTGAPLKGHLGAINEIATTPDGRYIVSVSDDKTIGVWDLESRHMSHRLTGHTDEIWCIATSPKGNLAVTGSKDRTVRIWDVFAMDGSHVVLGGHNAAVWRVFVTDDGLRAISIDVTNEAFVWDLENHNIIKRFIGEEACRLSRQEVLNLVGEATVQDNAGLSITLGYREIWYGQSSNAKVVATLECSVESWDLSPDKKTICVGLWDGNVAFLKLKT